MKRTLLYILFFVSCVLTSCDQNTVYFHYQPAALEGWEKNDSIVFDVPPIERAGVYAKSVGFRIDTTFPFKNICLIVEETVYPRCVRVNDTVYCSVTESDGTMTGAGFNIYQYEVTLNTKTRLLPGDSIHYSVRHNMKRSILPGVTDVGVRLKRER